MAPCMGLGLLLAWGQSRQCSSSHSLVSNGRVACSLLPTSSPSNTSLRRSTGWLCTAVKYFHLSESSDSAILLAPLRSGECILWGAGSENSTLAVFEETLFGWPASECFESPLGRVQSDHQMSSWVFGLAPATGASETTLSIGVMACTPCTNVAVVVAVLVIGFSFSVPVMGFSFFSILGSPPSLCQPPSYIG